MGLLVVFLTAPVALFAQQGKVRVIVENASIRAKPDMSGEVIDVAVPMDTILDVQNKVGEWFEIKISSQMGVSITGYIHEMFVEIIDAEDVSQPAQPVTTQPVTTPPVYTPPPPAYTPPRDGTAKGAFGIHGAYGLGPSLSETSDYNFRWGPWILLQYAEDTGFIDHKVKNPMGFGASFSYLFFDGFGIEFRFDMFFKQSVIAEESISDYTMDWKWLVPPYGPYDYSESYDVTGEMSVMPISLNLIYKFQSGSFAPYITAGGTFFLGKIVVDTFAGKSFSFLLGNQYIDNLIVPIYVDDSLSQFGFNAGAGVDIMITPSVAFHFGGTYFVGSNATFPWMADAGTISSSYFELDFDLTQDDVDDIMDDLNILPLEVNLSFFQILFGIKILF
jgi:opacity protein-like surface antigen